MSSSSPRPKRGRHGNAKPIEDPAVILEKQASAVGFILEEAKQDPELYQRIVDNLNDGEVGRAQRWCDYRPVKNFYVWCSMTTEEDRPPLHTFLTLLAAHRCLAHGLNDRFTQLVKNRKLVQWARQELQPKKADSQAETITVTKKEDDGDRPSSNLTRVAQSPQVNREKPILSIEKSPRLPVERLNSRQSPQGNSCLDEPFHSSSSMKRKVSPESEQREAGRKLKTAKDYHGHHRTKVYLTNSSTQTDNSTPDMNDKFLSAMKQVIEETLDKKLVECLPAAMREITRLNAEDEAARQQSDSALLARVMRAAEPHMALTRQIPQTFVTPAQEQTQVYGVATVQYEDVRPVAMNYPRGRIIQTDGQPRRLGMFQ
ncbi:hypothetical protein EDB81DRAFT_896562 [Dactylonectria macrodidyma]|uniref:Uncharacterized protein n=1 Tax=Dactylonectria macrodidyma TaxID=307937 RepID=A0A9P9JIR3_9HYPO|nr:hypothetical protein EDB81DRAFT_896562 [Dactylonectria macrodidyma]